MKAGKLAKPSVATATPPTFTAMKKVTQCTASSAPDVPSTRAALRSTPRSRDCRMSAANTPMASTAKAARPSVTTQALAWISAPRMPVMPNSTAAT